MICLQQDLTSGPLGSLPVVPGAISSGTRAPKASHMALQSGSTGLMRTIGVCSARCWEPLAGWG